MRHPMETNYKPMVNIVRENIILTKKYSDGDLPLQMFEANYTEDAQWHRVYEATGDSGKASELANLAARCIDADIQMMWICSTQLSSIKTMAGRVQLAGINVPPDEWQIMWNEYLRG